MSYARWATRKEVAKQLVPVNNKTGVEKGGIPIMFDEKYIYIHQREAHNLIIGATGSGKTQVSILPTLKFAMLAEESFVINDPKAEIYCKMANKLKEENYNVVLLDFNTSEYGNSWNPLQLPYEMYKDGHKDKSIRLLENLAYYIFADPKDKSDPFWTNTTISYFTGLTLYLFENAKKEEININSIYLLSSYINEKQITNEFLGKLDINNKIYSSLVGTLKAPNETKGSILSVFNQKIKKYILTDSLNNMLSTSDFDLKNISKNKTALFIVGGTSNYCERLIPLLVHQVIEATDCNEQQEKTTHILLDEFDSLVPIKDFTRLIDYARSIKIRFTVVIKSYKHLINMYTKEEAEILKLCFGNIIYLLSNDIYTLEEISKYCGNQEKNGKIMPLITPEELKTLECFHAIVIMPRTMPFKTELLPDYKINWFYETTDAKLPTRKENEINIFKL